ncbi:MAG: NAD-dependent epimerase/dehydratase family protein, partial [Planctomycetota bacterium]
SNLAGILADRGWEVRCLLRDPARAERLDERRVAIAIGALDDVDSLSRAATDVDVVFHVAGRVCALSEAEFHRDNVTGTRNVAQACDSQSTPPTLVCVSSLAAGGPGTRETPRRENAPDQPASAYGRSKLAAENAAREWADRIPLSIVRPPIIFGPGDKAGLSMYRSMKFLPIHLTPGLRRFPVSLVDVRDLCDALERVALRGQRETSTQNESSCSKTGIYYVGAERDLTYGEFGRLAGEAAGWAVVAVPVPRLVFWLFGAIGEAVGRWRGRPLIVNLDKVREATQSGWVCSCDKLRQELGFRPAAPLEQRLSDTVAWYRRHGWL